MRKRNEKLHFKPSFKTFGKRTFFSIFWLFFSGHFFPLGGTLDFATYGSLRIHPPLKSPILGGGLLVRKYFLNYVSYWHDSKFPINFIDFVIWKNFLVVRRNFYRPSAPLKGQWICQKLPKNGIFCDIWQNSKILSFIFARNVTS